MEMKEIIPDIFLTSHLCVWYRSENTVIIADIHLGYESSLADEGITVPRVHKKKILNRLSTILDRYSPKNLIIAGDLKHEFSKNRDQEFREIFEIIDYIQERTHLSIVRGNHDNFLRTITESAGVPLYEEKIDLGEIRVTHGHRMVDNEKILLMGHEHPSLKIRDEIGATFKLPCFLYHPTGVIVLPAFSPLAYGRDMIRAHKFISNALEGIPLPEFHVYGVSDEGLISLSTLKNLRESIPDII